jgi:hypothetical protein
MRNYFALLLIFLLAGCLEESVPDTTEEVDETFVVNVPATFDWSNISGAGITVSIKSGGVSSDALDSTLLELYDEDDVLLDALTVYDGSAEFNVRIPASAEILRISSVATGESTEISADESTVDFTVANVSALAFLRVDSDSDGLFDAFDVDPLDGSKSVVVGNNSADSQLKSASAKETSSASYVIFEDLWPSKGDYDFNDLIAETTFSWERGKSNYIETISGVCSVEWNGAGLDLGLGFELFEVNGTNLYYLDDVIVKVTGATEDENVGNGIIVVNNAHSTGLAEVTFSMEIKDKQFKDFICVPYLFRTNDYSHQIRPYGYPPTKGQDMSLLVTNDDRSPARTWDWSVGTKFKYPLSGSDAFFRTSENHPWGIEFITSKTFKPCTENVSIITEYPTFKTWAESGGKDAEDWYDNPL